MEKVFAERTCKSRMESGHAERERLRALAQTVQDPLPLLSQAPVCVRERNEAAIATICTV